MLVNVLITTYNRPEKLKALVGKLNKQDVNKVIVFNDGSSKRYGEVDAEYFRFGNNHGKREYYKLVNMLFTSRGHADLYIMLPDDAEIDDDFIRNAVNRWGDIKDSKKICLNLLADNRVENWTKFKREKRGKFWLSQWNDMCFIAEDKFFKEIGEVSVSSRRWDKNKRLGSGVGQFISNKLYSKGYNMYQVRKTLVGHGTHESVMNPEARRDNPIVT